MVHEGGFRVVSYNTPSTIALKGAILDYIAEDGLVLENMPPAVPMLRFQQDFEIEGKRDGVSAGIEHKYDTGNSFIVHPDSYLAEFQELWPRAEEIGKSLASDLFNFSKQDVAVHSAELMYQGVNRPIKFGITAGDLHTDIYWKPFSVSRVIGNYLWNLLSGRAEHRFKASKFGIVEEAATGMHEWEFSDPQELATKEYRDERFKSFILATHVGLGDFAIRQQAQDIDPDQFSGVKDEMFYWKNSQYVVTPDHTIIPFDFDYLYLPDKIYDAQVADLTSLDGITKKEFDALHEEEDVGLRQRYTKHETRLKDLVDKLRPLMVGAYMEQKKEGYRNDKVVELFTFINQLQRRLKEHTGDRDE